MHTFSLVAFAALWASRTTASSASTEYAVQWTKMTTTCKAALTAVYDGKSDFSKCSGAGKLFQNLVSDSAVDADADLIPAMETWLEEDLCKTDACDYSVTTAIGQNVTQACSVDIEDGNIVALVAQGALLNYGAARRTLCLYDSTAKGNSTAYCPAEMLNNIKASGIAISYDSFQTLVKDPMSNLKSLKTWTYCQACGKGSTSGLVNILNNIDGSWGTAVEDIMNQYCGAGFADGSTPSTLGDGTQTTTTGSALPSTSGDTSGSAAASATGGTSADSGSSDGSGAGVRLQQSLARTFVLLSGVAIFVAYGI